MALPSCLRSSINARKIYARIVHPGGRVELYDRPILAAEIMMANPRCCVAFPEVFRQPTAVVSPDTVLTLGQKYYVVPVSTLRKLRRHDSPSLALPNRSHDGYDKRSGCFKPLFARGKSKGQGMSFSMDESFELMKEFERKGGNESLRREMRGSRRRRWTSSPGTPSCHWQPSLESITEE
ncbi:uncharacterized protein [Typha latifolia]|uniref:uncharacterized protein n=1 Tax=Typha latifolia TaxID=4733 RepID=UPI003C2ABB63